MTDPDGIPKFDPHLLTKRISEADQPLDHVPVHHTPEPPKLSIYNVTGAAMIFGLGFIVGVLWEWAA